MFTPFLLRETCTCSMVRHRRVLRLVLSWTTCPRRHLLLQALHFPIRRLPALSSEEYNSLVARPLQSQSLAI